MLWLLLLPALVVLVFPFLIVFIGVPVVLFCFPNSFPSLFFMNWKILENADYSNPEAVGVKSKGWNFYIKGEVGQLGIWHILPQELTAQFKKASVNPTDCQMEQRTHRVDLYNVLAGCGFHVFAFDYRGYGDSPGIATEEGITKDAREIYNYIRSICGKNQLIVWGHSMGSGVFLVYPINYRELSLEGCPSPDGLVLESAFNNLHDVVIHHPFTLPIRYIPRVVVERYVVAHFRSNGLSMESDERIRFIPCPILQFHAADDRIIPVKLARKLFQAAKIAGRDLTYVEFVAGTA